ncbi:ribonuclease T2 [Atractiella rhizophila]|nr:ribonuclease T2 [Atractiella rhizophila]
MSQILLLRADVNRLLQTQFWDTDPVTGPDDSWTIHGLWPDLCDGGFNDTCDSSRQYSGSKLSGWLSQKAPDTLSFMQSYWQDISGDDESFWEHEWGKHGTCISTLDPSCYDGYEEGDETIDFFTQTVALFKTVPTYDWLSAAGISPSSSATYTLSQIESALQDAFGQPVYVACSGNNLNQVWYYYNTKGNIASGSFIPVEPTDSSKCPSSGISYLPKNGGSGGGGGGGGEGGGSGDAPSDGGSGKLQVSTGTGCVLSAGTWSVQTCATFTATASGDGFTLKSSKGQCGVSSGTFGCGSGVSGTVFTFGGANLQYDGSADFSADSIPSGSTQVEISTGTSGSQQFNIQWVPS